MPADAGVGAAPRNSKGSLPPLNDPKLPRNSKGSLPATSSNAKGSAPKVVKLNGANDMAIARQMKDLNGVRDSVSKRPKAKVSLVGPERQKEQRRQRQAKRELTHIFCKFDADRNGALDRNELKGWMMEVVRSMGRDPIVCVLEKDVDNLMQACDHSQNGHIEYEEMKWAFDVWQMHLTAAEKIDELFETYDADGTGCLDKIQLRNLLVALNDGVMVADDEVDFVLRTADRLEEDGQISNKLEMELALSVWYHHVEENGGGKPLIDLVKGSQVRSLFDVQEKTDASRVGATRQNAKVEWTREQCQIQLLFEKYDKDQNGVLQKSELKSLMEDLGRDLGGGEFQTVDKQDVIDLMKMCDSNQDGVMQREEVLWAVQVWRKHVRCWPKIKLMFEQADTDHSGRLNKTELHKLLVSLNDGIAVNEQEVDLILKSADKLGDGKISHLEMENMLSVWYLHVEDRQQSACCSLQ